MLFKKHKKFRAILEDYGFSFFDNEISAICKDLTCDGNVVISKDGILPLYVANQSAVTDAGYKYGGVSENFGILARFEDEFIVRIKIIELGDVKDNNEAEYKTGKALLNSQLGNEIKYVFGDNTSAIEKLKCEFSDRDVRWVNKKDRKISLLHNILNWFKNFVKK